MIKIRYHHLMCIPRYQGNGYSRDFCVNLEKVKQSLKNNDYILVEECDDICLVCPNNIDGKCADEEKVSRYDSMVKSAMEQGKIPFPKNICSDCSWFYICKNI